MQIKTIIIKFDGQLIRTELPLPETFTGNMTLSFNWKDGKLLVAQASKSTNAEVETQLSTMGRGEDVV